MELIARTIGNAAGLWLALTLVGGLTVPGSPGALAWIVNLLVVGLVLALVNSLVRPVAKLLAFPLYVLTFGLFSLVVNGLMLMLTSRLTDAFVTVGEQAWVTGLHVETLTAAVIGSLLISMISAVVVSVIGPRQD